MTLAWVVVALIGVFVFLAFATWHGRDRSGQVDDEEDPMTRDR